MYTCRQYVFLDTPRHQASIMLSHDNEISADSHPHSPPCREKLQCLSQTGTVLPKLPEAGRQGVTLHDTSTCAQPYYYPGPFAIPCSVHAIDLCIRPGKPGQRVYSLASSRCFVR